MIDATYQTEFNKACTKLGIVYENENGLLTIEDFSAIAGLVPNSILEYVLDKDVVRIDFYWDEGWVSCVQSEIVTRALLEGNKA